MRTLKLTVAYDGTNYCGFQRQANGLSVQEVLEDALAPFERDAAGRGPTVSGAGRTDAGVHALGQVASVNVAFETPASAVQRALNARLPADVRVVGAVDATPGFHARHHARGKSYRYRVSTPPVQSPFDRLYAWHAPGRYDLDAMRAAAEALVGRHDFKSFQARGSAVRHTVRTMRTIAITTPPGEIVFEVEGDGFLRHMVRAVVGTLLDVGTGLRQPADMAAILEARDRAAAGPTAPAHGLTLVAVTY
ncbi:MAG: tRNA pseudouridine(38-40) synthase TruA [Vicinamibacterales bacterium]